MRIRGWTVNRILFLLSLSLVLLTVFPCVVKAADFREKKVTIRINREDGEGASNLQLKVLEDVTDSGGNVVKRSGDVIPVTFSAVSEKCFQTEPVLYVGAKYELTDTVSGRAVTFDTAKYLYTVSPVVIELYMESENTGLLGRISSPDTAKSGTTVKYTVDELLVDSGEVFNFHVKLPDNAVLESVYTGTYSGDAMMQFLYKTNVSTDWKMLDDTIKSTSAKSLSMTDAGLMENERITEFSLTSESVPAGFTMNEQDPACYYATVSGNEGQLFSGYTTVSTYKGSEKRYSRDASQTVLVSAVKTGDGNHMFMVCIVVLIVTIVLFISYVIYRLLSEREVPSTGRIEFKRNMSKSSVTMRELMDEQNSKSR